KTATALKLGKVFLQRTAGPYIGSEAELTPSLRQSPFRPAKRACASRGGAKVPFRPIIDSPVRCSARLEGRRVMDQDIDSLEPKRAQDDDRRSDRGCNRSKIARPRFGKKEAQMKTESKVALAIFAGTLLAVLHDAATAQTVAVATGSSGKVHLLPAT